jgi:hypothetical protein
MCDDSAQTIVDLQIDGKVNTYLVNQLKRFMTAPEIVSVLDELAGIYREILHYENSRAVLTEKLIANQRQFTGSTSEGSCDDGKRLVLPEKLSPSSLRDELSRIEISSRNLHEKKATIEGELAKLELVNHRRSATYADLEKQYHKVSQQ